ncbi:MAG: PAS domain-containing protein [Pseudomonadota bacterium]
MGNRPAIDNGSLSGSQASELANDLASLLDFTSDMLALLDANLCYIAANTSYCNIFNQPKASFPGRSIESLFAHAPEHYNAVVKPSLLAALQGEHSHFESWIDVPDKGNLYLELRYHPHRHSDGTIVGVVVTGRDRTEVTRSIMALEQSEKLLKRTEHIAQVGGWFLDMTTGNMQWTDEMYSIHELARDAPVSTKAIENFIPPEELPNVLRGMEQARAGTPISLTTPLITAKGNRKWVRSIAFPVMEGDKVTSVEGILQDITGLTEMQSGMQRALRSVESHRHILDQHALVAITDINGFFTHVNEKFAELAGYSRTELLGRHPRELRSGLHDENHYHTLWSCVHGGSVWQGESSHRARNGNIYWLHTTIVPLKDEKGTIEEFISVSTDLTSLKQTEDSLRRAQKMEAVGQLSGGIAHDFNNLLSIVIGNLELAEMLVPRNDPVRVQLENARNASLRGSVLTRRLLNFSQQTPIQGKALSLNKLLVGINVLISKSLTALITVQMDLHDKLWQVEADAGDFEDAIINLAINAGDAMPEGGKLTFTTRNHAIQQTEYRNNVQVPPGNYVEIGVSDTGIGMSREVMEKIFEPYYTTKPGDKGTGLGLPMVYGFVKRSKGVIFVESIPGLGSRFTIYLPKSEQATAAEEEQDKQRSQAVRAVGHETILLVDDEVEIVKVSTMNLQNLGYKVLACTSGEEALEILASEQPVDLLFTDVVMPGAYNGVELAEAALLLRPDLKVLFTTGYAKIQNRVTSNRWSNSLVQKPYRSADLSRKIRELLDS